MNKILLKLYYYIQRFTLKLALKSDQQTFQRRFMGHHFTCQNKWSFLSAIREIYIDECYKIHRGIKIHSILDVGANLGFSISYFKKQFPESEITAFEADPAIFQLLKNNVEQNHFTKVTLIDGAAWTADGVLEFFQDHSQGGSLIQSQLHKSKIETRSYDLKKIIENSEWDLLKIDIEGAEVEIIKHIASSIKKFKIVFIEYHQNKNKTGQLSEVLRVLEENNFKYSFSPVFGSTNLFYKYKENVAFDLQLNIHAVRMDQLRLMKPSLL